jgi:hypothetical protein
MESGAEVVGREERQLPVPHQALGPGGLRKKEAMMNLVAMIVALSAALFCGKVMPLGGLRAFLVGVNLLGAGANFAVLVGCIG